MIPVKQEQVNPRSYKSILAAMKSGQYKGRGQLMQAVVNAFRAPKVVDQPKKISAGVKPTITRGKASEK
jgi:hypothetical protein